MMNVMKLVLSCAILVGSVLGEENGNVCLYSDALTFDQRAGPIHLSELSDVLKFSLGYTVDKLMWNHVTLAGPFSYPKVAVIIELNDQVSVKTSEYCYDLVQDGSLAGLYYSLKSQISVSPSHAKLKKMRISELTNDLDDSKDQVASFLRDVEALKQYFNDSKSFAGSNQNIIVVNVDSLSTVVKNWGSDSKEVKTAVKALKEAVAHIRTGFKKSGIPALTAVVQGKMKNRIKRQAESNDVNVSFGMSDDFPAIFNIVLFLGILMFIAILASSVAIAFMDPGRDSIIYRMTNPRMKKDQ